CFSGKPDMWIGCAPRLLGHGHEGLVLSNIAGCLPTVLQHIPNTTHGWFRAENRAKMLIQRRQCLAKVGPVLDFVGDRNDIGTGPACRNQLSGSIRVENTQENPSGETTDGACPSPGV